MGTSSISGGVVWPGGWTVFRPLKQSGTIMPTPLKVGTTRAGVPRHRAHFYERRDADLHCPGVPPPPIPMSMEAPASSASPPPIPMERRASASIPTGTEGSSWDAHLADASAVAWTVAAGDPSLPSGGGLAGPASPVSLDDDGFLTLKGTPLLGEDIVVGRRRRRWLQRCPGSYLYFIGVEGRRRSS